jgi:aryl-alcohol dehydrogenase-like predicted oxidoreductase
MEETLEAFDDLVASGKVRYVGFTNLEAWRVAKAVLTSDAEGWVRFVAGQYQYSLVERSIEHEFVSLFLAEGIGLTCWHPLGGGFLSGKYRRGQRAAVAARDASLTRRRSTRKPGSAATRSATGV